MWIVGWSGVKNGWGWFGWGRRYLVYWKLFVVKFGGIILLIVVYGECCLLIYFSLLLWVEC